MENYVGFSILMGKSTPLLDEEDEPVSIHRIFEELVKLTKKQDINNSLTQGIELAIDDPAVYDKNTRTRLVQINEQANQTARVLIKNFKPKTNLDGDIVVAVHMKRSYKLIVTLLAILKVNGTVLPLDDQWPSSRIQYLLKETQTVLVIADEKNKKRFRGYSVLTVNELYKASKDMVNTNLPENTCWKVEAPELQRTNAVLYTSGSTGIPKGVRLSNQNILNRLKWQWKNYPYSITERVCLFKTVLTYRDSISELWGPLLAGRSLVIVDEEELAKPEHLIDICSKYKIERLVLTPSLLSILIPYLEVENQKKQPILPYLKLCVSSGEVLQIDLAKSLYECLSEQRTTLLNFYGSREATGDVLSYTLPDKGDLSSLDRVPIGKPIDNTNIYILDKALQPVKIGKVGEIYVSGLSVTKGFVRDTTKLFDNPFTNDPNHSKLVRLEDLGRMGSGMIYLEGQSGSQFTVKGHRVNLAKVEAAFSKVKYVDRFTVLCYKENQIDQALLAFIVAKETEEETLILDLSYTLPKYMIPKTIYLTDMPLLPNKKIDKQKLFSIYETQLKGKPLADFQFDFSGIPSQHHNKAMKLFQAVAHTLGLSKPRIQARSNFYQLGGNSLNSIAIVTKLCDMGYNINIRDFVSANTLLDVIYAMKEKDSTHGESTNELGLIPGDEYKVELIQPKHKNDIFRIITGSYFNKGVLENGSVLKVRKEHYEEVLECLWKILLKEQVTFIIKNKGEMQAVCINRDGDCAAGLRNVSPKNNWLRIVEYFDMMEKHVTRGHVLARGKVLTTLAAGTALSCSPQENVKLLLFMQHEIIRLAKVRGYTGVYTVGANTLMMELAQDVFNYELLLESKVNKYVTPDGLKLFTKLDDSTRAQLVWLDLGSQKSEENLV